MNEKTPADVQANLDHYNRSGGDVSLNPYSTVGARYKWHQGWKGNECSDCRIAQGERYVPGPGSCTYRGCEYQQGRATRQLHDAMPGAVPYTPGG